MNYMGACLQTFLRCHRAVEFHTDLMLWEDKPVNDKTIIGLLTCRWESTHHRWIRLNNGPVMRTSNAFITLSGDTMTLMWHHCNDVFAVSQTLRNKYFKTYRFSFKHMPVCHLAIIWNNTCIVTYQKYKINICTEEPVSMMPSVFTFGTLGFQQNTRLS